MNKFVGLIILDGLGLSAKKENNAVYLAKTPYLDYLLANHPNTTLKASGLEVGLPEGQMGNSEVGHLNLGSGRVIDQYLTKINKSINDESFFLNEQFLKAINHVKQHNSKIHLLGLISDGGVHSYLPHFESLLDLMKKHQVEDRTYLHAFTDGRDTEPYSGIKYMQQILNYGFKVASVSGRYFALDRDNNWDRINLVYNMLTSHQASIIKSPLEGIRNSYTEGISDEFIQPFIVDEQGLIDDNDSVIFVNFRSDRIIRLAVALSNPSMTSHFQTIGKQSFQGNKLIKNIFLVTMTFYSQYVSGVVAFKSANLKNIYGEIISSHGLHQLRIAETEKYPHVTFFFDGGKEQNFLNVDNILVPSPKVKTYDLKPEMSAFIIVDKAKTAILSQKYQTMILNFANPDMVGHTGSLEATIKAVETVDKCLKEVVKVILKIGGIACVVADHGNAEQMVDDRGEPHTSHTTNLVPFILINKKCNLRTGSLCDVAPTLLELLEISKPQEMKGQSLILH
ncbi:MAG: 2,3-bisphosphoglycerate-independent phosphoglycerate mutase [Phytoplasma sp.]|uniref:2,3-bisphosphoglycerate-independent phosphoglycerate mutase n=1 Tax=Phytoplasma sp. TaxID=2155 RepID=UPI002B401D15|nr:2,3-bisphosphoglycerate-independent phosphoglycerate mutase [Phytoplasma sp.]WRH06809.1 MAG: 2,3-bisphosphoglycerate-independent phosphoglycerate mutase [Phytoplasma sp.]